MFTSSVLLVAKPLVLCSKPVGEALVHVTELLDPIPQTDSELILGLLMAEADDYCWLNLYS